MIVVAAAVIIQDGWMGKGALICKRAPRNPPDPLRDGYWECPGGKVNPGETPRECVLREIGEELEIEVEILEEFPKRECDFGPESIGKVEIYFFLCRIKSGYHSPKAGIHDAIVWVSLPYLGRYKLFDANRAVIEEVLRRFVK